MESSKRLNEPLLPGEPQPLIASGFTEQVYLLTRKNLLITFKNPKNLLFLIITPFLLSLFLYAFGSLALENGNTYLPNPTATALPAFPKCGWSDCLSLDVRFVSSIKAQTYQDFPWMVEVVNSIRNSGIDVSTSNPTISTFP
jgi:hypothetical protein